MRKLILGLAILAGSTVALATWLNAPAQTVPPAPASKAAATPIAAPGAIDKKEAEKSPAIYDEKADAKKDVAAALARAKKENHRVLIQWGGNWCGWCIALHSLYEKDDDIKKELLYDYEVVLVDSGHGEKNTDLSEKYKADFEHQGFPYLTILDTDGKVVVNQETSSLEVKDKKGESVGTSAGHDKAKVLAFLKDHAPTYPKAADLLSAALAEAKASNRKVFLHFGAPWCGWCRRLEAWMDQPDIERILQKDFVLLKIDEDRTVGGKDVEKTYGASGGIPWFAFLDGDGHAIITSMRNGENIGYPGAAEEIDHFHTMLTKAASQMTSADIDVMIDSLKEAAKKIKTN